MIELDKSGSYKSQISDLYLQVYSNGLSAQKIDLNFLNDILDFSYNKGLVLIDVSNSELRAALLSFPLKFDELFPYSEFPDIDFDKTIYIAELMVEENFRKKGLAKGLLNEFYNLSVIHFNQAMIRVWDENVVALDIYEKNGFEALCTIKQEKYSLDGTKFFMQKRYLCRTL